MRRIEFKMERPGLLEVGQKITVTEGLLPSNYYYTIDPSLAMSPNIPFRYRLKNREGVVADIVENSRGFYVTAEFDEPEVDMTKMPQEFRNMPGGRRLKAQMTDLRKN